MGEDGAGAVGGGMEATMFSHWIYYHLKDRGANIWMGHAARMKAICAGKKKSDKLNARRSPTCCGATCFRDVG